MVQTNEPTISVEADNAVSFRGCTSVGVLGENFQAGTAVNILAEGRRGTAIVQADRSFQWLSNLKPQIARGGTVLVTVHGADGIVVRGSTEVVSP